MIFLACLLLAIDFFTKTQVVYGRNAWLLLLLRRWRWIIIRLVWCYLMALLWFVDTFHLKFILRNLVVLLAQIMKLIPHFIFLAQFLQRFLPFCCIKSYFAFRASSDVSDHLGAAEFFVNNLLFVLLVALGLFIKSLVEIDRCKCLAG